MTLEVRVRHRVHPALEIDATLTLGDESGVIFGPSGAGKSTLLRLIAGLTRPDSGSIRLGDRILLDRATGIRVPLRGRGIGLIFQDDLLFPHLNAEANVRFGLRGWAEAEARGRLAEVAALCGIEGLLARRPSALSGGERQRVGLARALAPRPRLLLCDEPVSALDLDGRHALIERLKAARAAEGIPMLTVTHSPDEAIQLGNRVFRLERGRIVAEGSPLDVLAAGGVGAWGSIRNVFEAIVESHDELENASTVRLVGGPSLIVPRIDRAVGVPARVQVRSHEIVLARGPVGPISARNQVEGVVDRVIDRGGEAEVVVRIGRATWVVGVVASAVRSLGLIAGSEVRMIIKARNCHVLPEDGP